MISKSLKKRWLAALRSGKFKKGIEQLGDSRMGYCCLGVLCKITRRKYDPFDCYLKINDRGDAVDDILTANMQETLAKLNDKTEGFEKVASYISRNLKAK